MSRPVFPFKEGSKQKGGGHIFFLSRPQAHSLGERKKIYVLVVVFVFVIVIVIVLAMVAMENMARPWLAMKGRPTPEGLPSKKAPDTGRSLAYFVYRSHSSTAMITVPRIINEKRSCHLPFLLKP